MAYIEKLDHMEWLIFVLDAVARIRDANTRAEIQSLGMELLLEKASRLRLMDQLVRSAAYTSAYKQKAAHLPTLESRVTPRRSSPQTGKRRSRITDSFGIGPARISASTLSAHDGKQLESPQSPNTLPGTTSEIH